MSKDRYYNSGKKFKNCECYKTHANEYSYYKPNVSDFIGWCRL